jgi:hypothetical protein
MDPTLRVIIVRNKPGNASVLTLTPNESEREINGFRPGADAHILPIRRVGLSGRAARVMSGSVRSSARAGGLLLRRPGCQEESVLGA